MDLQENFPEFERSNVQRNSGKSYHISPKSLGNLDTGKG